jgi:transportin-1
MRALAKPTLVNILMPALIDRYHQVSDQSREPSNAWGVRGCFAGIGGLEDPDKDFLITNLDLLSAIIQALDPAKSEALVVSAEPRSFAADPRRSAPDRIQCAQQCLLVVRGDRRPVAFHKKVDLSPYLDRLYQGLLTIISNEEVIDLVNENAALAVGRLGIGGSESLAPRLGEYADEVDVQDRLYAGPRFLALIKSS